MPREPKDRRAWLNATWRDFSKMVRVEAADSQGLCECVTCDYGPSAWNSGEIHAGHYLGGRYESILFEETCVHCQCRGCNTAGHINFGYGGLRKKEEVTQRYHAFMISRYGQEEVDRLLRLRNQPRTYSIDELRQMRSEYRKRADKAIKAKGLKD